jgi:hypothetical protein
MVVRWAYLHGVAFEPRAQDRPADLTAVWVLVNGERLRLRVDTLNQPPDVALLATMSHGVPFLADPPPVPAQPAPLRVRVRIDKPAPVSPGAAGPARPPVIRPVVPPTRC